MVLNTILDRFPIIFQGMPQNGSFEPREANITWEYNPIPDSYKSRIEKFEVKITKIDLTYLYNLSNDGLDMDSPEASLEISRSRGWDFNVLTIRYEEEEASSVDITSLLINFEEKKVEITVNY